MKLPLYETMPESIEINGKKYRMYLTFGRVLRYIDLRSGKTLSTSDMIEVVLSWFVPKYRIKSIVEAANLLDRIEHEYIFPPKRRLRSGQSKRTVDFNIDSGYIYAAFVQTYGIDLYEEWDRLHWYKFMSLFDNLPDSTAISQIMHIRGRDIPAPNSYNQGEIQRITELKLLYALPSDTPYHEEKSQEDLVKLFDMLYKEATGKR